MWPRLSLIRAADLLVLVNEDGLLANNHFSSNRGVRVFLSWLAGVGKA